MRKRVVIENLSYGVCKFFQPLFVDGNVELLGKGFRYAFRNRFDDRARIDGNALAFVSAALCGRNARADLFGNAFCDQIVIGQRNARCDFIRNRVIIGLRHCVCNVFVNRVVIHFGNDRRNFFRNHIIICFGKDRSNLFRKHVVIERFFRISARFRFGILFGLRLRIEHNDGCRSAFFLFGKFDFFRKLCSEQIVIHFLPHRLHDGLRRLLRLCALCGSQSRRNSICKIFVIDLLRSGNHRRHARSDPVCKIFVIDLLRGGNNRRHARRNPVRKVFVIDFLLCRGYGHVRKRIAHDADHVLFRRIQTLSVFFRNRFDTAVCPFLYRFDRPVDAVAHAYDDAAHGIVQTVGNLFQHAFHARIYRIDHIVHARVDGIEQRFVLHFDRIGKRV